MRERITPIQQAILFAFMILIIISSVLIILNYSILFLSKPVSNINYAMALEKYVKSNNLELPLPNVTYIGDFTTLPPEQAFYLGNFNKDVYEFQEIVKRHYIYNELYDCKYWTYVWLLYWKNVRHKYNWDMQIMTTPNHIYLKVYNETGYCILDQTEVFCLSSLN